MEGQDVAALLGARIRELRRRSRVIMFAACFLTLTFFIDTIIAVHSCEGYSARQIIQFVSCVILGITAVMQWMLYLVGIESIATIEFLARVTDAWRRQEGEK